MAAYPYCYFDPTVAVRLYDGDNALVKEILGMYRDQIEELKPLLLEPIDVAVLAATIHRIKGATAAVGMDKLLPLILALEEPLRNGKVFAKELEAFREALPMVDADMAEALK